MRFPRELHVGARGRGFPPLPRISTDGRLGKSDFLFALLGGAGPKEPVGSVWRLTAVEDVDELDVGGSSAEGFPALATP